MKLENEYCLVVGAGSIGERYIRNLWSIGFTRIAVLRSRNLPFRDVGDATLKIVRSWTDVSALNAKVAFICTPTAMHLKDARRCIELGMHVLVEKPLSNTMDGIEELKECALRRGVLIQVGYMMRYHPLLEKVRNFRLENAFGNLLYMNSYWAEYLPDWHPWEDYRESYAARKTMGGGVALTLSHDLDLSNWIAGEEIEKSQSLFNYKSMLEIDVEAGADFLISYKNGVTSHVHLNYFQKSRERWYQYVFEEAVIRVDFFNAEMLIRGATEQSVLRVDNFDRNQLFLSQLQAFFTNIENPGQSLVNIRESEQIIKMCSVNE